MLTFSNALVALIQIQAQTLLFVNVIKVIILMIKHQSAVLVISFAWPAHQALHVLLAQSQTQYPLNLRFANASLDTTSPPLLSSHVFRAYQFVKPAHQVTPAQLAEKIHL